jgi:hypothetical protein
LFLLQIYKKRNMSVALLTNIVSPTPVSLSGGICFATTIVPAGTAAYSINAQTSQVICPSNELRTAVTWTLPKASTCPGLQMSLVNKSLTAVITLATTGGDYLPSYLSPPTIPVSTGPGNDQFYYFESDGINTWQ